jgi:hypothetical protein
VTHEPETLWDLAAGQRASMESPLDALLLLLSDDADLRSAAKFEAITQLREVLRGIPATVAAEEPVAITAQSAVLLARLLLARFR